MRSREYPTKEVLRGLFSYDPEGFLVWRPRQGRGVSKFNNKRAGCVIHKSGPRARRIIEIDNRGHPAARLIWIWHHGTIPDGRQVDHINRCSLDDRIENLRIATLNQNAANRATKPSKATGFIGVLYRKDRDRYLARAKIDGKEHTIGHFRCPVKAAEARDRFVLKRNGEFAVLNFGDRNAES